MPMPTQMQVKLQPHIKLLVEASMKREERSAHQIVNRALATALPVPETPVAKSKPCPSPR